MYDALCSKICKKTGKKELSKSEVEYVVSWKEDYKMKDDMILEGFNIAIRYNKVSFQYVNAIISAWYKEKSIEKTQKHQSSRR